MSVPRSILSVLGLEQPKKVAFVRSHERIRPSGLRCSLGEVLDLSAGGARVQFEKKPELVVGHVAQVSVGPMAYGLRMRSRVIWVRRCGWKDWQAGLQFIGVDEPTALALVELARTGHISTAAPSEPAPAAAPAPAKPGTTAAPCKTPPHLPPRSEADAGGHDDGPTDLYTLLSVGFAATEAQIRASFRALASTLHPDHNKAPDASARFCEVTKAYKVLIDPETRGRYDVLREQLRKGG